MNFLEELSKPLSKDDVELRIGNCSNKGFSLLLYKTARTDVKRLNKVCGINWKNEHFYDSKGLLCCTISVFDGTQWVDRTDVGVESQTEAEKGSYSDSFKRAGFRWGIGLELYQSPFIWINWETKEAYKTQKGKPVYQPVNFFSSNLEISKYGVNENGEPYLSINYQGKEIYSSGYKTKSKQTDDDKKKYWNEFQVICKSLDVDAKDFLSEWAEIDLLDKKAMFNAVAKYLKDKEMFTEQLINYKDNKNENI